MEMTLPHTLSLESTKNYSSVIQKNTLLRTSSSVILRGAIFVCVPRVKKKLSIHPRTRALSLKHTYIHAHTSTQYIEVSMRRTDAAHDIHTQTQKHTHQSDAQKNTERLAERTPGGTGGWSATTGQDAQKE